MKSFEFQQKCIENLIAETENVQDSKTIILKAPTGSGKTYILDSFIKEYFDSIDSLDTVFVWLCPGDGNLQNQSYDKFRFYYPKYNAGLLNDILTGGFEANTVYFINWQKIIGKDRLALQDGEKFNLFDRIKNAHIQNYNFILIIDEEHKNDTDKSRALIDAFNAKIQIRASATIKYNIANAVNLVVDEIDVIESGLITKAIYINDGCTSNKELSYDTEAEYLIEVANNKLQAIKDSYSKSNININPLVLIQVPNNSEALIDTVEKSLFDLGYTYESCDIAKWLAEEKINVNDIERLDHKANFLIFKQGIATGWDCPRAQILIKLRDNMSEQFEIQTIGRIRRMPEAKHYSEEILNNSYLYTFDTKYVDEVINTLDCAYKVKRLNLKEKCKSFKLQGSYHVVDRINEKDLLVQSTELFYSKYHLVNSEKNQSILEGYGYKFSINVEKNALQGKIIKTENLALGEDVLYKLGFKAKIGVVQNKFDFFNATRDIAKHMQLDRNRALHVLQHLFLKNNKQIFSKPLKKVLSLNRLEFLAFIIHNQELLKDVFDDICSSIQKQTELSIEPPTIFSIPIEELYRIGVNTKNIFELNTNAYNDYTSDIIEYPLRSSSEIYFEKFCETQKDVLEWYYKNGDKGSKYFSISYTNGLGVKKQFYPDYICCLKSGKIWIIETKGGSINGKDKNIDLDVSNKFEALKNHCDNIRVNFAFVRDVVNTGYNTELVYSNTKYSDNLQDPCWKSINDLFKNTEA